MLALSMRQLLILSMSLSFCVREHNAPNTSNTQIVAEIAVEQSIQGFNRLNIQRQRNLTPSLPFTGIFVLLHKQTNTLAVFLEDRNCNNCTETGNNISNNPQIQEQILLAASNMLNINFMLNTPVLDYMRVMSMRSQQTLGNANPVTRGQALQKSMRNNMLFMNSTISHIEAILSSSMSFIGLKLALQASVYMSYLNLPLTEDPAQAYDLVFISHANLEILYDRYVTFFTYTQKYNLQQLLIGSLENLISSYDLLAEENKTDFTILRTEMQSVLEAEKVILATIKRAIDFAAFHTNFRVVRNLLDMQRSNVIIIQE